MSPAPPPHPRCRVAPWAPQGFTLMESMVALVLLGVLGGSVVMTVDRALDATDRLLLREQAFYVARENLETVLTRLSVKEGIEQGTSERYPVIRWETRLEIFSDPVGAGGAMWARAVCVASFDVDEGETESVTLEHWLTEVDVEGLTASGVEEPAARTFSYDEALEYAGVDEGAFAQWVEAGLRQAADGSFIEYNLNIFIRANGQPTEEEVADQVDSVDELRQRAREAEEATAPDDSEGTDPADVGLEGPPGDAAAVEVR